VLTKAQVYLMSKLWIRVYIDEPPQWMQRIYRHFQMKKQGKDEALDPCRGKEVRKYVISGVVNILVTQ
jgi:hypothetical protein